jgi:lipid II:glycine glycyltransferase (peptidoglycan interpeptide bridge formation enzyme)
MQLTNPFTDSDFADFQIQSGKASKVHKINKTLVYQYPIKGKFCMFYTTSWQPEISLLAKKENAIYTLVESYQKQEAHSKAKKPFKNIIPQYTQAIDLQKSEDKILKEMHSKGRYNIRLATKKGIQIKQSHDIDSFYRLLQKTGKRDHFHINPKKYYQALLQSLYEKGKAKMFLAFYNEEPIAGIINTYIDNTATYYYGASSYEHRNLMAPYALQWHAIKDAKKNKFQTYDFLGIADPNNPKDPLVGVTNFKQKFGGQTIKHPKGFAVSHKPLLYLALKLKKMLKL